MKKTIILVLFSLFFTSCSVRHKVEVPADVHASIGPDFEGAAAFCDDRYGKGTKSSEECFLDFRNYFKLGVDINSLEKFCSRKYHSQNEIDACVTETLEMNQQFVVPK